MNGDHVGRWSVDAGNHHEFVYDEAWLQRGDAYPVSLSLPLPVAGRAAPFRGDEVRNFFDNLLPENRRIRERLRERFHTDSDRAIDLLAQIGRDCVGAVQLLPVDAPPPNVRRIDAEALTSAQVGELLRNVTTIDDESGGRDFRFSLAGAQEKTALLLHLGAWAKPLAATPTTHILKLPPGVTPSGIDLASSVENEWLCAQLLTGFKVPVAQCEIADFDGVRVLVVTRFDRRLVDNDTWIRRLPQEDFAQIARASPDRKYECDGGPGIRFINDQLFGSLHPAADRRDFFRTQVLFWMLAAIDGHAKNFSVFIERGGAFRLTPRYDVMSAFPVMGRRGEKLDRKRIKMAMAFDGKNRHYEWVEIAPRHIVNTARLCGLTHDVEAILDEIVAETPVAIGYAQRALPKGFPESVAAPIFAGLQESARKLRERPRHSTIPARRRAAAQE